MIYELIHTSALQGLSPVADGGYCTVAATEGIPKPLENQLVRMSAYSHRVRGVRADHVRNPVAFSHSVVSVAGERYHVVSRVADAGSEHSDRTNYLAHHLAFTGGSEPAAGPAWLCSQSGLFQTEWPSSRPPMFLKARPGLPDGSVPLAACHTWERTTGDAGWAGVLAESWASRAPTVVVYRPGQPTLAMLAEAMALLPRDARWRVTFSTYYSRGAPECQWQFVTHDSKEAAAAGAGVGLVIRLDERMHRQPEGGLVEAARTGDSPREFAAAADLTRYTITTRTPKRSERSPVREQWPVGVDADQTGGGRLSVAAAQRETPTKPLIIGLLLGGALAVVSVALLELAKEQSLLRNFGYVGPVEQELRGLHVKHEALDKKYEDASKLAVERERDLRERDDLIGLLNGEMKGLKDRLAQTDQALVDERGKVAEERTGRAIEREAATKALNAAHNKALEEHNKLKARPPISATPVPLSPDGWWRLPPSSPPGVIELLSPPLGSESGGGNRYKVVSTDPTKAGTEELNYDPATGVVKPGPLGGKLGSAEWAAAVVRVTASGTSPARYFQLASPYTQARVKLSRDKTESGVFHHPAWANLGAAAGDRFAFSGPARVQLGKGQEEVVLVAATDRQNGDDYPDTLVAHDINGKLRLKLSVSGGRLALTFASPPPDDQPLEPVVTWAEIVPRSAVKGLSTPPVVFRFQ